MTQSQSELIRKWRGEYQGGRVTFPTSWHKKMYELELRGEVPQLRKVTKSLNYNFGN